MADEKLRLVGAALNLKMFLTDGDATKFLRTFLNDEDGAPITPASVDLTNVGNGLYVDSALAMPNLPFVRARHVVYDDSGYSVVDCTHPARTDDYRRQDLLPTQLPDTDDLSANFGETPELEAQFEIDEMKAQIESDDITATIQSDDIESKVEDPEVIADLESDEITANLE